MIRRLLAVLAALTLVAAGCGDDDDDPTVVGGDVSETTAAPAGGAPVMGPAELSASDQTGDGTEVVIDSVALPADGFVVVHADAGGSPGPVIGHTDLLPAGETTDVVVPLDEPLTGTATVWPMAHIDTNLNGEYDFAPPEVTEDGPATFDGGDVAVVSIDYTVEADGGGGDAAASGRTVTIAGFDFKPASIDVAPGTTVTWTNEDGVPHTVTAGEPGEPAGTFDEALDPGDTAEIAFDEAGTFPYFCEIHPNMTGEVVVS